VTIVKWNSCLSAPSLKTTGSEGVTESVGSPLGSLSWGTLFAFTSNLTGLSTAKVQRGLRKVGCGYGVRSSSLIMELSACKLIFPVYGSGHHRKREVWERTEKEDYFAGNSD